MTQKENEAIDVITSDPNTISTELNVLRFPLFSLADKKAKFKDTVKFPIEFEHKKKTYKGTGEISFNNKYGKPLRRDKRFFRAIESIMAKKGFPTSRYFVFDPKEVLRELGLNPYAGKNLKEIKDCVRRLKFTAIEAIGLIYDKSNGKPFKAELGVSIVDEYIFTGEEDEDGNPQEKHVIKWSDWYLASLNSGYAKPINLDYFFALGDVAGRLYELLSLKFFGIFSNRNPDDWHKSSSYVRYDYHEELCPLLPLKPQKYFSDAQRNLKKAHGQLLGNNDYLPFGWTEKGDGFISDFKFERVKHKGGYKWTVKYWPGKLASEEYKRTKDALSDWRKEKRALKSPESVQEVQRGKTVGKEGENGSIKATEPNNEVPEASSTAVNLTQQLIERGIRPRAAADLVKKYFDRIERNVEAFDFLLQNPENTIKNGAAYLRRSVEEDWFIDPPEGFVSKAQAQEQARQQEQASKELMQKYLAKKEKLIAGIDATLKLTDEQRVEPLLQVWEKTMRATKKQAPSQEERKKRQARYVENLPTRERLIEKGLAELHVDIEQQARQQGIEVQSFI